HGFLAFSEIHPDYYQIPIADRQALIAEEERAHRAAEDEVDRRARRPRGRGEAAHARAEQIRSARAEEDESAELAESGSDAGATEMPPEDAQPAAEAPAEPWEPSAPPVAAEAGRPHEDAGEHTDQPAVELAP